MIYTHEEFFSKYLEYTIPEKTVEDIVKLLDDNTPIHKTVEINKLNKFKVVHCNCSDAEFNLGMDARYEKDIDHIYIDEDCGSNYYLLLAHEYIHYLQNKLYFESDSYDREYSYYEKWDEEQAYKLESLVAKKIKNCKLDSTVLETEHIKIKNILTKLIKESLDIMDLFDYENDIDDLALSEYDVDRYFEENLAKHYY